MLLPLCHSPSVRSPPNLSANPPANLPTNQPTNQPSPTLNHLTTPQILSNFGNDVLEALSGTCTQWLAGGGKKRAGHVAADAAVAGVVVTLHGLTLMCQVRVRVCVCNVCVL